MTRGSRGLRRGAASFCAIAAAASVLVACGSAKSSGGGGGSSASGQTFTFRLGSVATPTDPVNLGAQKWIDLVEQMSKGRITIKNLNSGSLGPEPQELTQIQSGALDMFVGTAATVTTVAPEAGALLLPYAFPTLGAAHKYMDSSDGQALMKQLNTHKLKVMAFGDNGYLVTFGSKPYNTPSDEKGQKIRVLPTFVDTAVQTALGAVPENTAYNELYLSLSQHAIDGSTASLVSYAASNLTEVAKQLSLTNQELSPIMFIMSPAAYNRLPSDLQKVVTDAATQAAVYQRQQAQSQIDSDLAALPGKGVTVTKPDLVAFADATKGVASSLASKIGQQWVDGVQKYSTSS